MYTLGKYVFTLPKCCSSTNPDIPIWRVSLWRRESERAVNTPNREITVEGVCVYCWRRREICIRFGYLGNDILKGICSELNHNFGRLLDALKRISMREHYVTTCGRIRRSTNE